MDAAAPIAVRMTRDEFVEQFSRLHQRGGFGPNIILSEATAGVVYAWSRARPADAQMVLTEIAKVPEQYRLEMFQAAAVGLGPDVRHGAFSAWVQGDPHAERALEDADNGVAVAPDQLAASDLGGMLFFMGVVAVSPEYKYFDRLVGGIDGAVDAERETLVMLLRMMSQEDAAFREYCERQTERSPALDAILGTATSGDPAPGSER